ncbi:MAG: bifunctional 23S rRNA (guanine(2069)-N(7))-methyltransferase RlmK/23S rRNA (guanine(2445)-N(2))-methyltransferase RlmL [Candidatus Competibacter denitrificans]
MDVETIFFATAPSGIEPLLANELSALGAIEPKPARGGIRFAGSMELAYRACLWSRTASRVLLPLVQFPAESVAALYQGVHAFAWEEHLAPDGTLSVEFAGTCPGITHSHFGAQRVKDAIVDRFRAHCGQRPNVDRQRPDLRLHVLARAGEASVSLDLSGDSLHRRGYRQETVAAPLKETLAAALLLKAGWPAIAAAGGPLLDPMCGSGTLALEAAWIAGDHAPGLLRTHWGFAGWLGHSPALWKRLINEAIERREAGRSQIPIILASDHDPRAVRATLINADRAGMTRQIQITQRDLAEIESLPGAAGLVMVNPPYGERLGATQEEWKPLYRTLGERLKTHFTGWQAAVLTADPELGKQMGLRAEKTHVFFNGPLECRLLRFRIEPSFFVDREAADRRARTMRLEKAKADGAEDFINRLRKNVRHISRWAEREGIGCYRLYDADLPDYAVAIDRYEQWLHVQEYAPPAHIDPERAAQRLNQVLAVLPAVLELPADQMFLKVRERQKGPNQYRKQAESGHFCEVREGPARFLVNFSDYLDTGLFLDHRLTRHQIGELATGRRFLNLFGYTATATVYAALGGAASTTTVDLSSTYLDWAKHNLELNGIRGTRHQLIQADCLPWLTHTRDRYDLIFLDPPTFSNSKRMAATFDVQRDHVALLRQALRLLAEHGSLIFSTNRRKFQLDQAALADWQIEDWSRRTLPLDFSRNPHIHQCWRFTRVL